MQYVNTCQHELYQSFSCILFYVSYLYLVHFSVISFYGYLFDLFLYVVIFCVGAGIIILMYISDQSGRKCFRRKMEKTRFMKEEMDGEMFISRQSRHFFFIGNMIKVLFPNCTLNWRVNNYVSRQIKSINSRNESTVF